MRILVANFFPAFHPPRSGGEQRYYYLYHYLSRHYDITLLSPTYSNHTFEVVTFSPTFREHRVPKDEVFDQLHWKLGVEGIGPECSGYVVSLAAAVETQFSCRFDALVSDADLIIHESPFTLPYDRTLGIDGKARIYNAYNVEHRLAAHILRGETGRNAVEFIRFLEQSLAGFATVLFATCE
ncbi:MAG: glycosyl transferase group 1, partial [Betaproteobacteria bacterium]|nr:glycosyl transferase group 1 [Betaproteobacteria bacterium]